MLSTEHFGNKSLDSQFHVQTWNRQTRAQ